MNRPRLVLFLLCAATSVVLVAVLSSAATGKAGHAHRPPADRSRPRIIGTAQVGHTLRASTGHWIRAAGFTFRWKRCNRSAKACRVINGKSGRPYTALTYKLTKHDVGHRIKATVIARNAWGRRSATSHATAVVKKGGSTGAPSPGPTPGPGPTPTPVPLPGPGASGLHVSGNKLLDGNGQVVHLHGVNRSGTEYACIQGWGIFDDSGSVTSQSDAEVAAMASWNINIVRVPLNEDCWLGINGVPSAYAGQNYIDAIVRYVNQLHAHGMYAELSLMWGAPGTNQATYQPAAPDEDHSPAMWQSMATAFKNDPNVILAPWGETTVSWSCFRNGCSNQASFKNQPDYTTAGMQQAVNVMRQAGYTGPIAIPCIDYANTCSESGGSWLQYMPNDTRSQLLAEAHVYGKNTCDTTSCFNATMLPILQAGHPLIWGETGETYDFSDCPSTSYIQTFLSWAEQNDVGTEAWTWDTWGDCSTGSLISDYNGTPEDAYGSYVRSNYRSAFP